MRGLGVTLVQGAGAVALALAWVLVFSPSAATAQGSCCAADPEIADGLDEGFGAPPRVPPTLALASPGLPSIGTPQPARLVFYFPQSNDESGTSAVGFKAWLDADLCPLPVPADLDDESKMDARFAKQVVLGALHRGDGRVRVELRARALASGTETAPLTAEAQGEDRAAIAAATRQALKRLGLFCEG